MGLPEAAEAAVASASAAFLRSFSFVATLLVAPFFGLALPFLGLGPAFFGIRLAFARRWRVNQRDNGPAGTGLERHGGIEHLEPALGVQREQRHRPVTVHFAEFFDREGLRQVGAANLRAAVHPS